MIQTISCRPDQATMYKRWLLCHGGINLFRAVTWNGLLAIEARPAQEPTQRTPYRVVTSASEIVVCVRKDMAIVEGAVRFPDYAIKHICADFGAGAGFTIDPQTGDALIFIVEKVVPLNLWQD